MKILFATLLLTFMINVHALFGQLIDHPKASLTLQFEQTSGTNASSVTFNPKAGLYYTSIAGNDLYPLEVFDANGNNVYQTEVGVDLRGLWWNNDSRSLEGNCYNDGGIVTFLLSDNALPSVGQRTLYAGDAHQPQSNSCGVYDSKKKQTLYYNNGLVYKYKKGRKVGVLKLVPSNVSDINSQSMIYTGVKSMEIGVLDFVKKKVYLYNKKTGARTATITLPSNAVTHSVFRFAYANNYVFLYDADNRTWSGYRIFI